MFQTYCGQVQIVPHIPWQRFPNTVEKEPNGNLRGISEYAMFSDLVNENVVKIINDLLLINPNLIYFVENPRGRYA